MLQAGTRIIKRWAHRLLRRCGYNIVRTRGLLGLEQLPIRTIIDVGANEGQYARYLRKHLPQAKVYSFEPVPVAFDALRRWASTQDGMVEAIPTALGENKGTVSMRCPLNYTKLSSMLLAEPHLDELFRRSEPWDVISVPMATLDGALADRNLDEEILVKLDVQGY